MRHDINGGYVTITITTYIMHNVDKEKQDKMWFKNKNSAKLFLSIRS